MNKIVRRLLCLLLMIAMVLPFAAGCTESENNNSDDKGDDPVIKYTGPYSDVNGSYGGVDDLGRELSLDGQVSAPREKYVGIFYFLWQGEHGTGGPYDNHKIATLTPDSLKSEKLWKENGGGNVGEHHFWGEPLFGYYTSKDTWVMRKHCQMLTDAGVDFIFIDATNGYPYVERFKELFAIWYEYMQLGWDVPQIVFYTNSSSANTINTIYRQLYGNKRFNETYPEASKLWFHWDGKPLIIGNVNEANFDKAVKEEIQNYFRIKASVWPNAGRHDDGFPWMEFDRILSDDAVYGLNGRKEVVNVSVAQHSATCTFSFTAWYGANDRTRSWHDGANDTSEDAILWGYNFAEQWEWALEQDPEMIAVTGWNEWVAQRQPVSNTSKPIVFVDCADPNNSRDVEPMRGLYGDNYYMQLCEYIKKYKGTAYRVNVGGDTAIDVNGSFDQWDNSAVTAKYLDYTNDIVDRGSEKRNYNGFGGIDYVDTTGRNDIANMKVAKDKENIYFYVDTVADITAHTDANWMTLFIDSGIDGNQNWYGYDFAVNVAAPKSATEAVLSKCNGGWSWSDAGSVTMKIEGNKMMIAIPRSALGLDDNNGKCVLDIQFKWADNYQEDETNPGTVDIWSFYEHGDVAPYGRLNYVFSEKVYK